VKLITIFCVVSLVFSVSTKAAGPLGEIEKSIGKIANNAGLDKAIRDQAKTVEKAIQDAELKIVRDALIQQVTENALADRVKKLEERIAQQQAVIADYENLVTLLRAELKDLSGE